MFLLEMVDGLNRPLKSWYLECSEEELDKFVSMLNSKSNKEMNFNFVNEYNFHYYKLNY